MSTEHERVARVINATEDQQDELRRVAEGMGAVELKGAIILGREAIATNPVPLAGQIMVHALTGEVRFGDGMTPWSELPTQRTSLSKADLDVATRSALKGLK